MDDAAAMDAAQVADGVRQVHGQAQGVQLARGGGGVSGDASYRARAAVCLL